MSSTNATSAQLRPVYAAYKDPIAYVGLAAMFVVCRLIRVANSDLTFGPERRAFALELLVGVVLTFVVAVILPALVRERWRAGRGAMATDRPPSDRPDPKTVEKGNFVFAGVCCLAAWVAFQQPNQPPQYDSSVPTTSQVEIDARQQVLCTNESDDDFPRGTQRWIDHYTTCLREGTKNQQAADAYEATHPVYNP